MSPYHKEWMKEWYKLSLERKTYINKQVYYKFPYKELTTQQKYVGDHNKDYGRRALALNIVPGRIPINTAPTKHHPPSSIRRGFVNLGLRYGTEQKVCSQGKKRGEAFCIKSERNIYFLIDLVTAFLAEFPEDVFDTVLTTMRATSICGALTFVHTDAYRGNTYNYILWHQDGCKLQYYPFPEFHCCVVSYRGKEYIPVSYSETGRSLKMLGRDPKNPTAAKKFLVVNVEKELSMLVPIGKIPTLVVVAALGNGKLQVDVNDNKKEWYTPENLEERTIDEVFQIAHQPENAYDYTNTMFRRPITVGGRRNKWSKFYGWKHRHGLAPNSNADVPRTNVFFRQLRENPTAENFNKFKNGKKDYIVLDDACCEPTADTNTVVSSFIISIANVAIYH